MSAVFNEILRQQQAGARRSQKKKSVGEKGGRKRERERERAVPFLIHFDPVRLFCRRHSKSVGPLSPMNILTISPSDFAFLSQCCSTLGFAFAAVSKLTISGWKKSLEFECLPAFFWVTSECRKVLSLVEKKWKKCWEFSILTRPCSSLLRLEDISNVNNLLASCNDINNGSNESLSRIEPMNVRLSWFLRKKWTNRGEFILITTWGRIFYTLLCLYPLNGPNKLKCLSLASSVWCNTVSWWKLRRKWGVANVAPAAVFTTLVT